MDLAAHSLNLWGCPVWGVSVIRPWWFHFQMMALIVLMWILNLLVIFWYPIPWLWWSIITFLTFSDCFFVFIMVKTFEYYSQKFPCSLKVHADLLKCWCLCVVACSGWSAKLCIFIIWIEFISKQQVLICFIHILECTQNFWMLLMCWICQFWYYQIFSLFSYT